MVKKLLVPALAVAALIITALFIPYTKPGTSPAATNGSQSPISASSSASTSTADSWTNGMTIVTQADNGKTVTIPQSNRFAIRLGDSLQWSLSFDPDGMITRVPNTTTADGFQGVYEGTKTGTTVLHATGRPDCKPGEMCAQFIVETNITFVVTPNPDYIPPSTSGIRGNVLLGPTCPVERIPPDPQCADRPYETNLALVKPDGTIILTFQSDKDGLFKIDTAPGEYSIRLAPNAPAFPRCASNGTVSVPKNGYATTTVYCDTGIR